jgi:hypothetical protein
MAVQVVQAVVQQLTAVVVQQELVVVAPLGKEMWVEILETEATI